MDLSTDKLARTVSIEGYIKKVRLIYQLIMHSEDFLPRSTSTLDLLGTDCLMYLGSSSLICA